MLEVLSCYANYRLTFSACLIYKPAYFSYFKMSTFLRWVDGLALPVSTCLVGLLLCFRIGYLKRIWKAILPWQVRVAPSVLLPIHQRMKRLRVREVKLSREVVQQGTKIGSPRTKIQNIGLHLKAFVLCQKEPPLQSGSGVPRTDSL